MDIFNALADPTRRRILEILSKRGELSASDISAQFNMSAPAISQHLKALREAELVVMEKNAQQRLYRINLTAMVQLQSWAERMSQMWHQRFDRLDEVLKTEKKKLKKKPKS
jgi:DNA-binding transcriptional ArsR family regulator